MPQLVPIDHDPFADSPEPQDYLSLMLKGQGAAPEQPKMVPVDHDPFAEDSPPQPKQPNVSMAESAVRGYGQGALLGSSDEIMGGLGAAGVKGAAELQQLLGVDMGIPQEFQDRSLTDIYREGRGIARGQEAAAREANPWTYGLSEIGGGVVTGAKLPMDTPFKAASALGRVGNAAATGARYGAAYGLGSSEADLTKGDAQGLVKDAASGAGMGALTGTILQGGLERYAKSAIPTPKADDIKKMASQAYQTAQDKGGVLTKEFTNNFLKQALKVRPQTKAGRIVAGDDDVTRLLGRMTGLRGRNMSLQEAQEIDEILGNMVDGMVRPNGQMTKEGMKVLDLQTTLRNMIDYAPERQIMGGREGFAALKEGRRLWSAAAKLRDIEKIVARAELMQVPATGIKTGFRTLYSNPKRLRGFTEAEKKLIKQAAETGKVGDLLNTLGSRLTSIVTFGAGGGPVATGAAYIGSTAAREAAGKMQVNKADKVAREIVKRAVGDSYSKAPQITNYGKKLREITDLTELLGSQRSGWQRGRATP